VPPPWLGVAVVASPNKVDISAGVLLYNTLDIKYLNLSEAASKTKVLVGN
jgi:hypothetical protein